jgi:hypothetical protein
MCLNLFLVPDAALQSCRFAKYRDVMEAVHNFHGVLLACLVLAFEEVSASSSLFERIEVSRAVSLLLFVVWARCSVRFASRASVKFI